MPRLRLTIAFLAAMMGCGTAHTSTSETNDGGSGSGSGSSGSSGSGEWQRVGKQRRLGQRWRFEQRR